MSELKIPSREEILVNQAKQKDLWVRRNVQRVVDQLQCRLEGRISYDWTGSAHTGRSEENLEDCVILELRRLAPDFYFRKSDRCFASIEWSDRQFPQDKPWWRFW